MAKKMSHVKDYAYGYGMIAPLTIGLGVFYLYPVAKVFWDSFHEVGAFNQRRWTGLDNC